MTEYKYFFTVSPGVVTIYRAKLIKERRDGLVFLQPKDTLEQIACPKEQVFDALEDARSAIKKAPYEHYANFNFREVV